MITFSKFELDNGLKVIVHEDKSTPLVAINVLYNVGARDESPDKTGFAHLFEHLMFGGSANIPEFDEPMQMAGGENNAFTSNDITNFYNVVPRENIETVFWLESDRMLQLAFSKQSLDVQRKVVVEEFKETCLNEPYGDVWHLLSELAFKKHPYRWPTIGKVPKHVQDATLEDVKDFFYKYYRPNNAILTVAGNINEEAVKVLCEKWFGNIPKGNVPKRNIPQEPKQAKFQQLVKTANVPVDALYLAFHMSGRNEADYYATDLLSDILCNGSSSRLYRRLYKDQKLFNQIDAYVTGSLDPGLLVVEGKPLDSVSLEQGKAAIWKELEILKSEKIAEVELQKYKNKFESSIIFSEMSILNKAINLSFYEVLGDANLINQETEKFLNVTVDDIYRVANEVLTEENCSELYYRKQTASL